MYLEFHHPDRTVDEIFVKLCEGGDVLHLIQGFLVSYITNSQVERPTLGPEEYVTVRQVKCAMTAMDIWKSLCMRADSTVLLNKRAENAQNAQMYILHTKKNVVGRQHGEVRKITEWIERKLAVDFDLRYDQTFEKKEMTLEDIMCFLQVLWEHAQHIRCSPQTRLSVHLMILLAGITGFRPCEVLGLKYSQVKLEVVRSPRRPQERSLVAHITIRRAKRELGKVERSQKNIFSFSIALNSSGILCPLRMMVAQALHNDAFEVPYKSLQEILCRPNLGNENTLQIRWKPSILDKSIIPITYPSYWETFGRGVLVMGVRDTDIRLYALRVGAGQNLDGTLTAALRNYVMGHTGNVFQKSYQPQHFAHDLVSLAFKDHAGDNSELFSMLRNATLRKDLGAPIYPKKEDLQKWKQRKDLSDLKSQYNDLVSQSSTQCPEAKAIMAKMQHIKEVLSELRVAQLRKEYFSKIDRLRELGEPLPAPVDHINPFRTYNEKACLAARELGLALSQTTQLNQKEMSAVTDALVAYLGHQPFKIRAILQDAGMAQSLPDPQVVEVCSKPFMCLIDGRPFQDRGKLSNHNNLIHYRKGTFDKPFQCPACTSNIDGPIAWSNHTERVHGRWCSPNPPPGLFLGRNVSCADDIHPDECHFCAVPWASNSGSFRRHFNCSHSKVFDDPFDCPICIRASNSRFVINGVEEWQDHLERIHNGGGRFGRLHVPPN
ncbi:hypothetical protein Micbo1qcDRAFT_140131 [Microdochium bolleyi]|uniref:C2H2-type domain-containing protein n=1 Tax=Microdochium bolleyi TaxID=196109 RepID=A0A136INI6_9PEZI|nr:hypothetical protein Micbo1qcDRAFT_140131 [Microdochium bolleyi]